jgi:hypothetical protein
MRREIGTRIAGLFAAGALVAGCGSSSGTVSTPQASAGAHTTSVQSVSTATNAPVSGTATVKESSPKPIIDELPEAERPSAGEFPPARGETLAKLAKLVKASATLGAATGTFTPGTGRYAFGLTANTDQYVYAPTAIYLARSPTSPVTGPYLAPADPMGVAKRYRSAENSGPFGIQAIYETTLPLARAGTYSILAVTRSKSELIGSAGEIAVASSSLIPNVGQRPPAIQTETLASVHGDVSLLTTREPPEQMHAVSFASVLGKRPIALLFSTPELCLSRICGPVTDIVVSLQHEFPQITFIHQEIYVANNPAKGLRPQLHAFHLETEPWLYVVNAAGVITARLQGAFGVNAARAALQSALR